MGWTYTRRTQGEPLADFFRREFGDGVRDVAVVGFTEAYIAYETPEGEVVALVCKIRFEPSAEVYNFGYKDMDETMGTGLTRCPERILDQLTPTDDPRAQRWRQACRDRLAERAGQPTLEEGDLVFFHHELSLPGFREDLFRVKRWGRTGGKVRFKSVRRGTMVRIPKFRDRDWTRVGERADLGRLLEAADSEELRERVIRALGRLGEEEPERGRGRGRRSR